jgi:hypothetical protein
MSFFRFLDGRQLLGKIKNTFLSLNIAKKLLIGYLSLSLLLVGISVFSLSVLKRLNRINETSCPGTLCTPLCNFEKPGYAGTFLAKKRGI